MVIHVLASITKCVITERLYHNNRFSQHSDKLIYFVNLRNIVVIYIIAILRSDVEVENALIAGRERK